MYATFMHIDVYTVLHKNKNLLAFINVLLYCVKSTTPCITDN